MPEVGIAAEASGRGMQETEVQGSCSEELAYSLGHLGSVPSFAKTPCATSYKSTNPLEWVGNSFWLQQALDLAFQFSGWDFQMFHH